ncbi:MAG: hypothetical protein C5B50_23925 [Verrucomicrobia bacterium]|nr:MAG: hypothetical protein C5B50_23925 [Verrucomicrobiota bacterium]
MTAAPKTTKGVEPLFRKVDWRTFLLVFATVWVGYYLTLAPEVTLEDSGELATGSFYAGIPHPPGYPLWTIYTWLWTVLVPIKNVAWRVALGEATSGAVAAGLLGLLVSRGSSLLMEGIAAFKLVPSPVPGARPPEGAVPSAGLMRTEREWLADAAGATLAKWENSICTVSGFVAGLLLGFNGFMWSQSVIVEVYSFSVASLMLVLVCLLLWIYAPYQKRYLYLALFFHGVCFTNHQTLIVAALGIEVAIAAADFRMGRQLWLGNSVIFLAGWILVREHILTALEANKAVYAIFHVVGWCSIGLYAVFVVLTIIWSRPSTIAREGPSGAVEHILEIFRDLAAAACILLVAQSPAWGISAWFGGMCAGIVFIFLAAWTWRLGWEWLVVLCCGMCWLLGASFYFYMPLAGMTNPPMEWGYPRTLEGFIHAFTRGQYEKTNPSDVMGHPKVFGTQLLMLGAGIIEEFNWVYAFLALVPFLFFIKMRRRERAWIIGITGIYFFLGILLLILLNPPPDRAAQNLIRVFFTASHTLIALMAGYGLTLIAASMVTHYTRFRRWGCWGAAFAIALALLSLAEGAEVFIQQEGALDTIKILFRAAAGAIGMGAIVALLAAAILETNYYEETGTANGIGAIAAVLGFPVAGYIVWRLAERPRWNLGGAGDLVGAVVHAFAPNQYGLPMYAGLILIGLVLVFLAGLAFSRKQASMGMVLGAFALMPLHPVLTHWSDNEERNHWFGYWFGHDMFSPPFNGTDGKPLYPKMTKDTILFGGTDPGRFCPTYMIFCDSFIPHNCQPAEDQSFDRRDVYLITQNALADGTYLNYLRAQYNRSAQKDPFFFGELVDFLQSLCLPRDARDAKEHGKPYTNTAPAKLIGSLSAIARPLDEFFTRLGDDVEKRRRTFTSWFTEKDFTDFDLLLRQMRLGPSQTPVGKYIYESVTGETRQLLSTSPNRPFLLRAMVRDFNRLLESKGLYQPERFSGVELSEYLNDFIKQNPQGHTQIRLNRLLLEAAFPKAIAKSLGGVYPDREIYIPTPEDAGRAYNEYLTEAGNRLAHDMQFPPDRFPKEPRQLKPGEDLRYDPVTGRLEVSGQVAVFAINGLVAKVIFDKNPKNEFYVEESFPLDWMYPHLTPYGIIMKVNRQNVPDLSEEVTRKDHEFWRLYSGRLIGDWINENTSVEEITKWVEKVYLRRDFNGFSGDRKFIRDDQAQKSFSKLRSAIAGLYAWRLSPDTFNTPPEYRPKTSADYQRLLNEADFAFRQAFAFCPYSPEAVFHYVNFLAAQGRFNDAYLIAATCQKLDPYNPMLKGVVGQLGDLKKHTGEEPDKTQKTLENMQKTARENPTNFQAAFDLAAAYAQLHESDRALAILDGILNSKQADSMVLRVLLQAYASITNKTGMQAATAKLEAQFRIDPANFNAGLGAAEGHTRLQNNQQAIQTLDSILANPKVDSNIIVQVAQQYAALMDYNRVQKALELLVQAAPTMPEAWYDLASLKAALNRPGEALPALSNAFYFSNQRLKSNPAAHNLVAEAQKDPRWDGLRAMPEYKKLVEGK